MNIDEITWITLDMIQNIRSCCCSNNLFVFHCQGDDDESSQSQEVPLVEQFTGVGIKVIQSIYIYIQSNQS